MREKSQTHIKPMILWLSVLRIRIKRRQKVSWFRGKYQVDNGSRGMTMWQNCDQSTQMLGLGNMGSTQPDRLARTHTTRCATHLLDGVEGAYPLRPTVRQPVGDLAAARQPLAAPEVTVLTQHPAGPRRCQGCREEDRDRQTDRWKRKHRCQNTLHCFSLTLRRLCLV